jgi:hypothetical protein
MSLSLARSPGLRPNWLPGELLLTGPAGERLGVFLVNVAPRSQGRKGGVVEMTLGEVLTFTLRIPHELADQDGNNIKYTFNGAAGRPVTAVFEAADFIVQLGASATCELHVNGAHHVTIESLNRTPVELIKEFRTLRLLTDDLRVIEAGAITRFRVPEHVEAVERVHIRNLRLMLEGHCVAHPTANSMTIGLSGDRDQSLDQFLNTDPKWMMFTSEPGSLEVLGQTIYLPALSYAAHFTVSQEQIDAAEAAFENNAAAGQWGRAEDSTKRPPAHVPPGSTRPEPSTRDHPLGHRGDLPEGPRSGRRTARRARDSPAINQPWVRPTPRAGKYPT